MEPEKADSRSQTNQVKPSVHLVSLDDLNIDLDGEAEEQEPPVIGKVSQTSQTALLS